MRKGWCFVITDVRSELYSNVKRGKKKSTPCSCVHLVLIVFGDTSADAEPEEIQVLVTRASPLAPGMCTRSVSDPFYCWVETAGRKLSHISRPVVLSLAVPAALSDEELGVVASLLPPSMCEG